MTPGQRTHPLLQRPFIAGRAHCARMSVPPPVDPSPADVGPEAASFSARVLVAVALMLGAALAALALAVGSGPTDFDLQAARLLQPLNAGVTGAIVAAVTVIGTPLVWDSAIALAGVVLWVRGHRFAAVVLVAGVLAADAGATAVKLVVDRSRPPGVVVVDLITQASFPSGHMTRAVVTGGLAVYLLPPDRRGLNRLVAAVAAAGAVLMGVARVAVGEHWFTDVLGATLFGVLAVVLIALAVRVYRRR
jgi:undecaprenyl-diphosphatase